MKKGPGGKLKGSAEARRKAEVILEVLAGTLSPAEAAGALGISPQKYYLVESRALDGLISGCEPRRKGRVVSVGQELEKLKRENTWLARQCARYQALVRASHKTVGVAVPKREDTRKRKKKPVARALKFARALKEPPPEARHEAQVQAQKGEQR